MYSHPLCAAVQRKTYEYDAVVLLYRIRILVGISEGCVEPHNEGETYQPVSPQNYNLMQKQNTDLRPIRMQSDWEGMND